MPLNCLLQKWVIYVRCVSPYKIFKFSNNVVEKKNSKQMKQLENKEQADRFKWNFNGNHNV